MLNLPVDLVVVHVVEVVVAEDLAMVASAGTVHPETAMAQLEMDLAMLRSMSSNPLLLYIFLSYDPSKLIISNHTNETTESRYSLSIGMWFNGYRFTNGWPF